MSNQASAAPAQTTTNLELQQCLSFELADELYGVDILAVEEIRVWETPTLLPHTPVYIRGVINLRGMIVPIMDLRVRFGVGKPDYDPTTVVIFVRSNTEGTSRLVGLVVDAVSDVNEFDGNTIEQPSHLSNQQVSEFVRGMVNVEHKVMSMLDVDRLMALEQEEG